MEKQKKEMFFLPQILFLSKWYTRGYCEVWGHFDEQQQGRIREKEELVSLNHLCPFKVQILILYQNYMHLKNSRTEKIRFSDLLL